MKQGFRFDADDLVIMQQGGEMNVTTARGEEFFIDLSRDLVTMALGNGHARAGVVVNGHAPRRALPAGPTPRRQYSDKQKARIIEAASERGPDVQLKTIAERFGVHPSLIRTWIARAETAKKTGKTSRRQYDAAFRARALEAVRNRGDKTYEDIAKALKLRSDGALYRWLRAAKKAKA